jgi:hypothetical protein
MQTKTKQTIIEKEIEMPTPDPSDAIKVAVMNTEIKHVNETMVRIEGKFDKALENFVTTERVTSLEESIKIKNTEQDAAIKKLEDWNVWALRIVVGAVILAVLGLIFVNK